MSSRLWAKKKRVEAKESKIRHRRVIECIEKSFRFWPTWRPIHDITDFYGLFAITDRKAVNLGIRYNEGRLYPLTQFRDPSLEGGPLTRQGNFLMVDHS